MCPLTQLAHFQDLAQHLGELDAAAAERTLVLVLPAAVLEDDLRTEGWETPDFNIFPEPFLQANMVTFNKHTDKAVLDNSVIIKAAQYNFKGFSKCSRFSQYLAKADSSISPKGLSWQWAGLKAPRCLDIMAGRPKETLKKPFRASKSQLSSCF